ncbi:putative salt-induced outer membrane protein [Palleronia aestuarii]|uniref:Putative salt-induced outer membrane protein n=1 Tax=Palleronia aestuarii TaxID=568105 RepID=A0A2W7NAC4_9RHOB|nr:DUF481 domain-containing protein [Palleronia aestuarii]PZX16593.1 putative salt-induced outer membrane protein [Palleronia aestuarii]
MQIKPSNIFALAVISSFVAATAQAQNAFSGTGTGLGESAVEQRNDDLADDIEDDFERDIDRFGNEGRELGFDGSIALRATTANGNDESIDAGIGANFGYYDGANGYELSLSYIYGESEDRFGNTNTTDDNLLYDFQYTRDFTPVLYGFAKLQGSYTGDEDEGEQYFDIDGNPIELDSDLERRNDVFLGFGVGYRFVNTADTQWSVQAGPGYRFADFNDIGSALTDGDLLDGEGEDVNEAAFALSSNYYQRINEMVFVTNDTDIISSSDDTVLYNDLGANVAMADALALRASIRTEYHTDPVGSEKSTDNIFGLSLVYNLN